MFKQNEIPDLFGNYSLSKPSKRLTVKPTTKCNCYNCRLDRFEFNSIISDTISSTINETTSIQADLELAYANYKIGNFHQSYRLFEEVANKAWQAGKYFSYYISKYNIKRLRNLIKNFDLALKNEKKKRIFEELDDIDFDKLLSQIPFMGEKEYELLKMVSNDEILHKVADKIDELYNKILTTYDGYKGGSFLLMGPYYPQSIEIELYKIFCFYSNNYIVADEFRNFTKVCKKAVEALLISFATSENYNERIKEFNKLFFDVVVFYCDTKEFKAILQKYGINKIFFNENNLPEIIDSVNNFLKSFFYNNLFFISNTHADKLTRNQISNEFFEYKCRKIFNNIFFLLSKIDLSKDQVPNLIQNLLSFIAHETFLHSSDIEYLNDFITCNYKLFSKEDLENLLKLILHKLKYDKDSDWLRMIANAFKQNDFLGISNKELIFNILSLSKTSNSNTDTLIYLWTISNAVIKEELKQLITSNLDKMFNIELYTKAALNKIIDYNQYFVKYLNIINDRKGISADPFNKDRTKMQNFEFINAIIFILNMNVKSDDSRLKVFTNLEDYMKFYLNPKEFNYIKFKIEWLTMVAGSEIFYKRFAKIPPLKREIEKALKEKFDTGIAELYIKYFTK